jgi:hypothetical protein
LYKKCTDKKTKKCWCRNIFSKNYFSDFVHTSGMAGSIFATFGKNPAKINDPV